MLTYLTAGESHGPQLTAVIDGLPSGLRIDISRIDYELSRRQKGYGRGGRMAIEKDQARIVSGVRHGFTMGGPVTIVIGNRDWSNWADAMHPGTAPGTEDSISKLTRPRPGHADLAGGIKWNHHDLRNVLERASARETAARVALGALARQFLEYFEVQIASHVLRIGPMALEIEVDRSHLGRFGQLAEASEVRCVDPETSRQMMAAIKDAKERQDSLGGVVEVIIRGLPVGLGSCSQWHRRLDGQLARAMMSVQSVKGVEIGPGFEMAGRHGSEVHDQIYFDPEGNPLKKRFYRKTNNAGGLEGGITNGEDVVVRVAAKPISTLSRPLDTVDVQTKEPARAAVERADTCAVPALAVICEAAASLVLAEAFLEKFGSDNLAETERNYRSFLSAEY